MHADSVQEIVMLIVMKARLDIAEKQAKYICQERRFICGKSLAYPERKAQELYSFLDVLCDASSVKIMRSQMGQLEKR